MEGLGVFTLTPMVRIGVQVDDARKDRGISPWSQFALDSIRYLQFWDHLSSKFG